MKPLWWQSASARRPSASFYEHISESRPLFPKYSGFVHRRIKHFQVFLLCQDAHGSCRPLLSYSSMLFHWPQRLAVAFFGIDPRDRSSLPLQANCYCSSPVSDAVLFSILEAFLKVCDTKFPGTRALRLSRRAFEGGEARIR